jgi:hypothetical protein
MILLRDSGKPKIVSPGKSIQHSAISKNLTATDEKHAKENKKGKFPSSFASFATFAVNRSNLWLSADC